MSWSIKKTVEQAAGPEPFSLRNLRLAAGTVTATGLPGAGDGLLAADLVISGGLVAWVGAPGSRDDMPPGPDLGCSIAWPCPVDCHTHLDKGQTWARSRNSDGTFRSAVERAHADAVRSRDRDDIRRRAEFQLRSAHAHGTRALRTHVDGGAGRFDLPFRVLTELADEWRDRLTLQICPFTGPEEPPEWVACLAQRAEARPQGVLGAFLYTTPRLLPFLDEVISLAERHGLALDFHADENLDPGSHCLRAVAEAVIRNRFFGPVLVGHCCALSVQDRDTVGRTLDLVAAAGIGVVSLPLCNSYLMGRDPGRTPRDRGFAPVHEMRARGIPVALASDNVRDPFHAYGDLDVLELFRDALRMMHLDHPVGNWAAAVTTTAAELMGLPESGALVPGCAADIVIFRARNWSEFAARPLAERVVLRGGNPIGTTPPDYRELDGIEGARI